MKLSVVILNYNVRHFLELCLKSVQAAITDLDAEIIVVDNNSPDDSCEMLRQLFPEVSLIDNKENLGFSKANNQGVKAAKGEYICILNPDTVVSEDAFAQLLEFASTKDNLGIVGCRLIDGAGKFLPESKRNVPKVKVAIQKLFGSSGNYYANRIGETGVAKVDILVGAFMFMKQEVFNEVKGFDEDYFMYGEDIDLSYKSVKQGYDNYYYGKTTIIHYKGESTLRDKFYAKRFYKAMQIFYRKHFKVNIICDAFVRIGILLAYKFRRKLKYHPNEVKAYSLLSKKTNKALENKLNKNIELISELNGVYENTEVIFDANHLSYKKIIEELSRFGETESLTFKILPENSHYIIGSNNSYSRGEVIVFEDN